MNDANECCCNDEYGKIVVGVPLVINFFDKNNNNDEKSLKVQEKKNQEDHDCDQEDDDDDLDATALGDAGAPSPAEIKLKMKKSLLEFRCKVEDAILGNYLLGEQDHEKLAPQEIAVAREQIREITLWGVPLLPSKAHEGTDVVLRKFLKAKDFKVNEAFDMLQKTLVWRRENNVDGITDEDLGSEFGNNAGFLCGKDREGRPVCYHACEIFKDRRVYKKTFGSDNTCDKYLRWRIQMIEKAVKKLCFREGGVESILQVFDLRNTPMQGTKELNSVSKKALILFQNYYPEIIHKNIIVYAPFWFYTSQVLLSGFMNQRNKKKFILARSQKVTQTLLKFIAPEHLPTEYGGLRRNNDEDFSPYDKVSELKIKGSTVSKVEFPIQQLGVTIMWDVTVVGWDVSYKEEFIPDDEGSYTVLLQNQSVDGSSTRNSFYISEPGKIVITVENRTYKKKKMFYRSTARTTVPMFFLLQ
ncbi:patellin-4-like [Glycine soja]|uniref:Patellin-4 n=1 Tax=Glycine soja TaxID=3848 RepID=A0A445HF24_GLYSO|nr:patellin-4-like [Glycine soja]KHN44959.1 Patellin-4 [Glycine soja]RZB72166.1 Patellin-4 [Glycine soja]